MVCIVACFGFCFNQSGIQVYTICQIGCMIIHHAITSYLQCRICFKAILINLFLLIHCIGIQFLQCFADAITIGDKSAILVSTHIHTLMNKLNIIFVAINLLHLFCIESTIRVLPVILESFDGTGIFTNILLVLANLLLVGVNLCLQLRVCIFACCCFCFNQSGILVYTICQIGCTILHRTITNYLQCRICFDAILINLFLQLRICIFTSCYFCIDVGLQLRVCIFACCCFCFNQSGILVYTICQIGCTILHRAITNYLQCCICFDAILINLFLQFLICIVTSLCFCFVCIVTSLCFCFVCIFTCCCFCIDVGLQFLVCIFACCCFCFNLFGGIYAINLIFKCLNFILLIL